MKDGCRVRGRGVRSGEIDGRHEGDYGGEDWRMVEGMCGVDWDGMDYYMEYGTLMYNPPCHTDPYIIHNRGPGLNHPPSTPLLSS